MLRSNSPVEVKRFGPILGLGWVKLKKKFPPPLLFLGAPLGAGMPTLYSMITF